MAHGFHYFTNAIQLVPSAYASWVDVDVSNLVPSGSSGVILEFSDTSATGTTKCAVRKNGSTDNYVSRTEATLLTGHCYNICGIDDDSKFEAYVGSNVVELWLIGYTDEAVVMFTNMVDRTTGTSGAWIDVSISDIAEDATGVICEFLTKEGTTQDGGTIRAKGSTDWESGKTIVKGCVDLLCGVNTAMMFQQRIADTNVETYVKGYTKAPVAWFTNYVNKGSLSSENAWTDVDCSANIPIGASGVILELANFNASPQNSHMAVRVNGSTDNRTIYDDRVRYTGHICALVGVDTDRIFQAYVKDEGVGVFTITNCQFLIHGYVLPEAEPVTPYSTQTLVEMFGQISENSLTPGGTTQTYEDVITQLIEYADKAIDDYCDVPRGYFQDGGIQLTNEYHDGVEIGNYGLLVSWGSTISRRPFLRLKHSPVLSVEYLEKRDSSDNWSFLTEGIASDFLVMENGIRFVRNLPTYDYKNVRVTYTVGYSETPGRIEECSARLAAAMAQRIVDAKTRKTSSGGGASVTAPADANLATAVFSDDLKRLVRMYRRKVPVKLM